MWARATQFAMPPDPVGGTTYPYPSENLEVYCVNRSYVDDPYATLVNVLQLGGPTLLRYQGQFDGVNGESDIVVTGVGFQPQCLIVWSVSRDDDGLGGPQLWTFGVATDPGTSQQWCTESFKSWLEGIGSNWVVSEFTPGKLIQKIVRDELTSVTSSGVLSSFDADGFTVAYDGFEPPDVPYGGVTNSYAFLALADPDGAFFAGVETQKDSDGVKSTTGVGFRPGGALFASGSSDSADTRRDWFQMSLGFATNNAPTTDPEIQCCGGEMGKQGIPSSGYTGRGVGYWHMQDDCALAMWNDVAGAWTLTGKGVVAFTSDGFDVDWSDTDGAERYFGYLAFDCGSETWDEQKASAFLTSAWSISAETQGLGGPAALNITPSVDDPGSWVFSQMGCVGCQIGTGTTEESLVWLGGGANDGNLFFSDVYHDWLENAAFGFSIGTAPNIWMSAKFISTVRNAFQQIRYR